MGARGTGACRGRSAPRWAAAAASLLLAAAWGCHAADEPTAPGTARRILLISLDTVRADRIHGPEASNVAPAFHRLATEGAVVAPFYAASNYTLPSHMSIFTGLDPAEHGVLIGGAALAPEVPLLAERLREAGFATASWNEGGYVDARYGFARGFDRYETLAFNQLPEQSLDDVLGWLRERGDAPWFLFLHSYAAHSPYGGYSRYRDEAPGRGLLDEGALATLREQYPYGSRQGRVQAAVPDDTRASCSLYNEMAERPQEQLACATRHFEREFPETAHFEEDLAAIRRSYDDRIGQLDAAFARVRALLEAEGRWRETLVVVTADHGEAFFEHGRYGHTYVPHQEVLRAPLIVSHPASVGPRVLPGPAWHLDLLPTMLEFAGLSAPEGLRGRSLHDALTGGGHAGDGEGDRVVPAVGGPGARVVFPVVLPSAQRPNLPMRRVAVDGGWKWVRGHPRFGDREGLLFDLSADPGEARNARSDHPEVRDRLEAAARAHEAGLVLRAPVDARGDRVALPGPLRPKAPPIGEEEREALRALGYVE